MNTKHTPGPLTVARDQTYRAQWTVVRSYGHQPNAEQAGVGHVMATARCYTESDATLYAAAPELLKALESIASGSVQDIGDAGIGVVNIDRDVMQSIARAAIAKATGGTK